MAYDVSKLNDLIIERMDPIIQVVEEQSLLRVLEGNIEEHESPCPSTYRATYIIPDVTITNCCEPYKSGGDTLEKSFDVECYKAGDFYCEKDIAKLFRGAGRKVKYTAGAEDAGAAGDYINKANVDDFIAKFNKLLLLGDKANPNKNLAKIDGWVTQAIAGGAQQINIDSGNLWEAYVKIYLALTNNPLYAIYGEQMLAFVPSQYANLLSLLMIANRVTYPDAPADGLLGLPNVKVVPTHAFDNNNTIFMVPARNLVAIMSDKGDEYTYDWDYIKDKEGEYYLWRIKGCIGVGIYDPTHAVVATIDPSVANNITSTINVNILNTPLEVSNDGSFAGPTA